MTRNLFIYRTNERKHSLRSYCVRRDIGNGDVTTCYFCSSCSVHFLLLSTLKHQCLLAARAAVHVCSVGRAGHSFHLPGVLSVSPWQQSDGCQRTDEDRVAVYVRTNVIIAEETRCLGDVWVHKTNYHSC